jgi:hypothetical protein
MDIGSHVAFEMRSLLLPVCKRSGEKIFGSVYGILIVISLGKVQFGRPSRRWDDNINMDFKARWIELRILSIDWLLYQRC